MLQESPPFCITLTDCENYKRTKCESFILDKLELKSLFVVLVSNQVFALLFWRK